MGSIVCVLDRDRHSYTARVVQCLATTQYYHSKMISLPQVLTFTVLSTCRALDLGHGGVYNSPAAAQYWEERFGDLFAGGLGVLGGIQENIDVGAEQSLTKEQQTGELSMEISLPSASTSLPALLPVSVASSSLYPTPSPSSTPPSPSSSSPSPTQHISVIYFPMLVHPTFISPIVSNNLY